MNDFEMIAGWLSNATKAVAFTGAGISTESGIPDFRSPGGVWAQSQPVYYDDFMSDPQARYEYWRQKSLTHHDFVKSKPNAGHNILARWQQANRLRGLITQNIDGLHNEAGSRDVLELHGTARHVTCLDCKSRYDAGRFVEDFLANDAVPRCPHCMGRLKHATISFGQSLDEAVLRQAIEWSESADLFFAIGSSLVVQPAASLPQLAVQAGSRLVIINRDPTPLDRLADVILRDSIGKALTSIAPALDGGA